MATDVPLGVAPIRVSRARGEESRPVCDGNPNAVTFPKRSGLQWTVGPEPPVLRSIGITKPDTYRFHDDGRFPNSRLPLLVYRQALTLNAAAMERTFAGNGWSNAWRDGIFAYHHFHSIAHEVLGIAAGEVGVAFGGPSGRIVALRAGDVVVIPAGVAHRNMGESDDFLVVGAYPDGAEYDIRRGDPGEHAAVLRNIAAVPLPECDPVGGSAGPLRKLWSARL